MRLRFKVPGWWIGISLRIAVKKREGTKVVGLCNKVGHRYCLFLDYDLTNKLALYQEIRSLQETYDLGNAYIFKTGRGYHTIFLDLLTYRELVTILEASTCDPDYIDVPQRNGTRMWVLRISKKKSGAPEFHDVLYNQQVRPISRPHRDWLEGAGVPTIILDKNEPHEEEHLKPLVWARYEA